MLLHFNYEIIFHFIHIIKFCMMNINECICAESNLNRPKIVYQMLDVDIMNMNFFCYHVIDYLLKFHFVGNMNIQIGIFHFYYMAQKQVSKIEINFWSLTRVTHCHKISYKAHKLSPKCSHEKNHQLFVVLAYGINLCAFVATSSQVYVGLSFGLVFVNLVQSL